jgi:copper chaperone CopZ
VLEAAASHVDHSATVTYDTRRTDPETMMEALEKQGFPAERMRFVK